MNKIKQWLKNQDYTAKNIFGIAVGLQLVAALFINKDSLEKVVSFSDIIKLFGLIVGGFLPLCIFFIIVSGTIAYPLYRIFRGVAEKYKQFFQYFSITFLISTILYILLQLK